MGRALGQRGPATAQGYCERKGPSHPARPPSPHSSSAPAPATVDGARWAKAVPNRRRSIVLLVVAIPLPFEWSGGIGRRDMSHVIATSSNGSAIPRSAILIRGHLRKRSATTSSLATSRGRRPDRVARSKAAGWYPERRRIHDVRHLDSRGAPRRRPRGHRASPEDETRPARREHPLHRRARRRRCTSEACWSFPISSPTRRSDLRSDGVPTPPIALSASRNPQHPGSSSHEGRAPARPPGSWRPDGSGRP